VRLRRAELRKRVNGGLELRFESEGLTSYAGLELLLSFLRRIDFGRRVREAIGRALPASDFGASRVVTLLLTMLICGGRRIRHLGHLRGDPVIARTCGLEWLPTARSVARWLGAFETGGVEALCRLNEGIAADGVREVKPTRLTIDIDGSVVSTGLQVEGAERGFNPHHRKAPSYYPITAYEAQSGMVLRVSNRPGNIHDGAASLPFLRDVFEQIDRTLGRMSEEYRMDGAFFRRDVLDLLDQRGAEYVIKVPFFPWLGLKQKVASRGSWQRVDGAVSCFETRHWIEPWKRSVRILVYRKRVAHESRKNFQLDLFDPNDGHYEYSAIATNRTLGGPHLWWLMCGRGTHEKVYGELKNGFAFDSVPTQRYQGNCAWQVLSVLAFNLVRCFQIASTAQPRNPNRKRRTLRIFESIQTLRFELFNRAGLLLRPAGRATLDVGTNQAVRERFTRTAQLLQRAA
jgi:Transposase DDE domain group 1